MSKRPEAHEAHELKVFLEFAQAVRLPLNAQNAIPCKPPQPDLVTTLNGSPCYFELGRLADKGHAAYVIEAFRRHPTPVTPDYTKVGYPQRDMLLKKLSRSYISNGHPIHLLLYFDNDAPHLEGAIPPMPFEEEAHYLMEPILRQSMGQFSQVWYFERYRRTVLWGYPQACVITNDI